MRKTWITALGLLAACALARPARAADHLDGPAARNDPTTDITDLFAWMSSDGARLQLVLDVAPAAAKTSRFSTAAKYVFHLNSADKYAGLIMSRSHLVCTFASTQAI